MNKGKEEAYFEISEVNDFWFDNDNGFLKPYLHDATIQPDYYAEPFTIKLVPHHIVKLLPHSPLVLSVITFLTDKPVRHVKSWDFKVIENVYIPEHNAYLQIAQIEDDWNTVDVVYEDDTKETIDMKMFETYRSNTTKPLKPEQMVDAVKIAINTKSKELVL